MGNCYNTAVIHAPVEQVWDTIRNFYDMSWAEGVITECLPESDLPGDQVGAKRSLNGAFHETLTSLNDLDHIFTYTIDDGPGPLAHDQTPSYKGTVHVAPADGGDETVIEWKSEYEAQDEQAVGEFCNPIYQALIGALQHRFDH